MRMTAFSLSIIARGYRAMIKHGSVNQDVYQKETGFGVFSDIPVLMNNSILESLEAFLEVELPLVTLVTSVRNNPKASEKQYVLIEELAEKREDAFLLYETMRNMLAYNVEELHISPIAIPERPANLKKEETPDDE